jgi:Na+/proline symporter
VTPALFAALTWKRATRQGGLASIVGGALATVFFEVLLPYLAPSVMIGTDAWGIPSFYPAAVISIGLLVVVSLMTPPPRREDLVKLFPEMAKTGR